MCRMSWYLCLSDFISCVECPDSCGSKTLYHVLFQNSCILKLYTPICNYCTYWNTLLKYLKLFISISYFHLKNLKKVFSHPVLTTSDSMNRDLKLEYTSSTPIHQIHKYKNLQKQIHIWRPLYQVTKINHKNTQ